MFIVKNLTNRTVILSDISAEISARKILDLERIATTAEIERSYDLRHALKTNRLQLLKHNITRQDKPKTSNVQVVKVERVIERDLLDDTRLIELIKKAVAETVPQHPQVAPVQSIDISEQAGQFNDVLNDLRNKIANFQPVEKEVAGPAIDPAILAELSKKPLEKISEELESNITKKSRTFQMKPSTDLNDLAGELE